MTVREVGSRAGRLVARVAGPAVAVPVVGGYVAVGAAVLTARALLDVARQTRGWLASAAGTRRDEAPRTPKAA